MRVRGWPLMSVLVAGSLGARSRRTVIATIVAALLSIGVVTAATEPPLPVRYMQRMLNKDGGYRYDLVARFVSRRACEKYRAMQAQITCVETSLCNAQPEMCKGRPVSSGPVSCWRDMDMGPQFGRCE